MVDSRPLGFGEIPTAAARLVIVLLPVGHEQPADGIPGDAPVIVTLPQPGIPSGSGEVTVADPEFATCYQAEMPALISFLIKCGAEPEDAPEAAQDAFRKLFGQWKTVGLPKLWLRKVAFPLFLRRPVHNAAAPEEDYDELVSQSAFPRFDFGEEERHFIALTRLLPTAQRAVLALHIEGFQTFDIAETLGMKPDTVRKNLKEARASLMKSLNLNDNTWTGQEPPPAEVPPAEESPAEESPAEESPAEESPAEGPSAEESPAEESSAEESPAEESPAEESPAEGPSAEGPPRGKGRRHDPR